MELLPKDWRFKILLAIDIALIPLIFFVLKDGFAAEPEEMPAKVGFIILGDVSEAGWNASHYSGIKTACDEYKLELLVRDNVLEGSGQCPAAIEELIDQGAGMIFLASYEYSTEAREIIDAHSDIAFATYATKQYAKNLSSYLVRMYEGRYLAGALAGMVTRSNVIGYVAALPTPEVCRGISAFVLGLQRVNPNAKVVVMWTNEWQDEAIEAAHAERLITEAGADILTYHQDDSAVAEAAEKFGVDYIAYNTRIESSSEHYLTSIVCRWDLFYKNVVRRYIDGELNSTRNRWIGAEQNAVRLSGFSPKVTPEMQKRLEEIRAELREGKKIFSGEIYDNLGNLRCAKDETIGDEVLLENIDWLAKGAEVLE